METRRPRYIAMWSGPRNISTALLRSWGNRPDTFVCDEPLYAHYLAHTGLKHPAADEVIQHQENDWEKVVEWLTGEIPESNCVFYQKQMAHHLLPHIGRDWLDSLTNCFLIREPKEMITSLIKVYPEASLEDTGLPQQLEIFRRVKETTGEVPPVIDSRDVLDAPAKVLKLLCEKIDIPFFDSMLEWPPGPRATDGIWAPHWYSQVYKTTSFQPFKPKPDEVPTHLQAVLASCEEIYKELAAHRLH